MKIRNNYILYINPHTLVASFGGRMFDRYITSLQPFIGKIWDCTLSELVNNLKILENKGYYIAKRKN